MVAILGLLWVYFYSGILRLKGVQCSPRINWPAGGSYRVWTGVNIGNAEKRIGEEKARY